MSEPSFICAASDTELRQWLESRNHPKFRAEQILRWIFRQWTPDPSAMNNLPGRLREELAETFLSAAATQDNMSISEDGTTKLLLSLHDRQKIECVIIPHGNRTTFCLSSQVGCPVRCRFCASGASGLERNLHAGEIVGQLILCCKVHGARPDNIVFMGIGEPLMNLDSLIHALDIITDDKRFAFAQRRITVSTSGFPAQIRKLADLGRQYNLAVSLHAPDDNTRKKIIPGNPKPIAEILDACLYYRQATGRMVTFEYTLIDGVNSDTTQAAELANLAKKYHAKVNIIPLNPVQGLPYSPPSRASAAAFVSALEKNAVTVTQRSGRGSNVNAACGQLRSSQQLTTQ